LGGTSGINDRTCIELVLRLFKEQVRYEKVDDRQNIMANYVYDLIIKTEYHFYIAFLG
jgi:hypothetical protein